MEEHASLKNQKNSADNLSIREQLQEYLHYWKWILLSILICLLVAAVVLRYSMPLYSASTTIMVKDDRKGGLDSELSAFEDLGLGKGPKSNLENETEVIVSRTIMESAVRNLNLNVSYYVEGRVQTNELYKNSPAVVSILDASEKFYQNRNSFEIEGLDDTSFNLLKADGTRLNKFAYGTLIQLKDCKIVVERNPDRRFFLKDYTMKVVFSRMKDVVASYQRRLVITVKGKNSSVVELSLVDPVARKAEDVLNTVIENYNEDAKNDKNYISKKTEEFINERLALISRELGDVERDAESYMKSRQVTSVEDETGIFLENTAYFEKSLLEVETQIRVTQAMLDFMDKQGDLDLVPINVIPSESSAAELIVEFNQAVLLKKKYLKSGTEQNSAIQAITKRISELRENIIRSLQTQMDVLKIRKQDLEKQSNVNTGRISQIPTKARELKVIGRQQHIKESLYLYLLQKREEIAMAMKVTPPNAKVIDLALASESPVSPKKGMIYLVALAIGLAIPLVVIFLLNLLDNKVRRRQDVEKETDVPFLGSLPRFSDPSKIVSGNDRSSVAEAFRIIRTNLEFMLHSKDESRKAKTIFVTSTIPKEGKTSIATNLASIIAMSGKKVLLMGLDIRNPKIQNYLNLPARGFTNYISQGTLPVEDFIVKIQDRENFYVLPAGVIPPNPAELLMSDKVSELFEKLKADFDYIVVDTAPVSLVADTLLIAKQADVSVYVMRANYLDKRMVKLVNSFYMDKKLPNMAIVLNDTTPGKGYGYGSYGYGDYGYGYGESGEKEEKAPWWKKFLPKK